MSFRDPWFLLLLLCVPLVFFLAGRTPSALRFSSLQLADQAGRSWRVRFARLPALLLALAAVCLSLGIAGPRTPDAETKISHEGIAIMAVVDCSGSMHARDLVKDDLSVDRLSVVKQVLQEFVLGGSAGQGRPDDMIGLVTFAGYADSLCPLTLDHGNLALMIDELQIVSRREEDGTALGDGLALAVERIRRSQSASKVVILLTDGVHNAGTISPEQAADLAESLHVKVYCIGAGTDGMAPFPAVDPFTGRQQLRPMYVEIDEETLRRIAERTGGQYFRATNRKALAAIYAEIDRLERTEVSELRYLRYTEHYFWFALASLGLVAAATLANETLFRTVP